MTVFRALAFGVLALGLSSAGSAQAAPQLYDTGPSQDIALVRFVNATGVDALVKSDARASGGLAVTASSPVSEYQAVRADVPVSGLWAAGKRELGISERVPAGGRATFVVWDAAGKLQGKAFIETPSTFDGMRASMVFHNVDTRCAKANLLATPQDKPIFYDVAPASLLQRALNPVRVTVKASCDGRPVPGQVELGQLEAGQRYSVFLLPSGAGQRLVGVRDHVAH